MPTQTPLAWKNLTHDLRRLAVAVSGVGFAVVLIFIELGFMNALLESTVQIPERLNGELVIVNASKYALPAREMFDLRKIGQASGVAGVRAAYPIYMDTMGVLRQPGARAFPIRALAFDLRDKAVALELPESVTARLQGPGTAVVDICNRGKYGIPSQPEQVEALDVEFNSKKIQFVGQTRLGIDFVNDGNLIMSPGNFATYFPNRALGKDPLSIVDLGIVKLEVGADADAVRESLQATLGDEIRVMTKDELVQQEMKFWRTSVPVGFIFLVGVYMGFVVGVIICYQIIYSDIADHMGEFATLKAMGYTNPYFIKLVLVQSFYLSLMGFIPGAALSFLCYKIISLATGLTMSMSLSTAAMVLLVTMLMCIVSGLLAVRKLLSLDPAELF